MLNSTQLNPTQRSIQLPSIIEIFTYSERDGPKIWESAGPTYSEEFQLLTSALQWRTQFHTEYRHYGDH